MPERRTIVRRLVARLRAIFEESWISPAAAGQTFRRGISAISEVNKEYLHLEDKAAEAPDLAWRAVQGVAQEKHAKAISDYAKAENDRIDLALKRRVFGDKARQEAASAEKMEAEASLAKLNELRARIQLATELRDLGIKMVVGQDGRIDITTVQTAGIQSDQLLEILTVPERRMLGNVVDVTATVNELALGDYNPLTLTDWLCSIGDRVTRKQPLCVLSGDGYDIQVLSPARGTIREIVVNVGDQAIPNLTVLCRIVGDDLI